jgi:hypothetical protein
MEKARLMAQTASARINDLQKMGWLRDSGRRKLSKNGRSTVVWELDPMAIHGTTDARFKNGRNSWYILYTDYGGGNKAFGPFFERQLRLEAIPGILKVEGADLHQLKAMDVSKNGGIKFKLLFEDGMGGYIEEEDDDGSVSGSAD